MNMRKLVLLLVALCSFGVQAQSFYFNNKEFTLVKTPTQSPAHCSIEIFSNLDHPINLRWKALFTHVPTEWVINFDDQTQNHTPVHHGDSADFVLQSNPELSQKLIIGATLNNQPGNATISFVIYNPSDLNEIDTIHFHFKVGELGLQELSQKGICTIENGKLIIINNLFSQLAIYSEDGAESIVIEDFYSFDLLELRSNTLYFFKISQGNDHYFLKLKKM